jgi:hypothetical protein
MYKMRMYVCTHICIYVCMLLCIYIYIYIYIYPRTLVNFKHTCITWACKRQNSLTEGLGIHKVYAKNKLTESHAASNVNACLCKTSSNARAASFRPESESESESVTASDADLTTRVLFASASATPLFAEVFLSRSEVLSEAHLTRASTRGSVHALRGILRASRASLRRSSDAWSIVCMHMCSCVRMHFYICMYLCIYMQRVCACAFLHAYVCLCVPRRVLRAFYGVLCRSIFRSSFSYAWHTQPY